jgi:hypothetical protein
MPRSGILSVKAIFYQLSRLGTYFYSLNARVCCFFNVRVDVATTAQNTTSP